MLNLNLTNRACLISQLVVLGTTLLANPAMSQDFGFLDYSQSREFFNQGSQQFNQEVKLLKANFEPVKIKLPQSFEQPQDFEQPNSLHQQQKLQPKLNLTSE